MTEPKRGRGRPPKDSLKEIPMTMLLLREIKSRSRLTAAQLESELMGDLGHDDVIGARWSRYARGKRSLSPIRLKGVYDKAVKAGYLPKQKGGFKSSEFAHLSLGISIDELKSAVLLANSQDRALVKQVAEVRSKLRALKSTLNELGEGCWDSASALGEENYLRQSEVVNKFDSFDQTLNSLRFDSLYFAPHLKTKA